MTPDTGPWEMGSLTVAGAVERFGLSEQRLFGLMLARLVRWKILDGKGTRLLSWSDLARYVAGLPDGGGEGWQPKVTPRRVRA